MTEIGLFFCFKKIVYPFRKPTNKHVHQELYAACSMVNMLIRPLKFLYFRAFLWALAEKEIDVVPVTSLYTTATTEDEKTLLGHVVFGTLNMEFSHPKFPGFDWTGMDSSDIITESPDPDHAVFISAKKKLFCMNLVDRRKKHISLPLEDTLQVIHDGDEAFVTTRHGYLRHVHFIYELRK